MEKRTAFLVIPYKLYFEPQKTILKSLLEIAGYEVIIAAEKYSKKTQYILEKIIEDISQAEIAVIELIQDNFNIAFETGLINRMPHLKTKACLLAAQYLYDQNLIPTDIAGLNLTFYNNIRSYIDNVTDWLIKNTYLNNNQKKELKTFASKYKFPKIYEDFKDVNKLRNNWSLYDASLNFSPEGMTFTNAHFPIHSKNFGLFNKYQLEMTAKIIQLRFGIAIHIQKDIGESSLPIPKCCIMFNIDTNGHVIPHIFIRNLINIENHYWVINDKAMKFDLKPNRNGFFEIELSVNESQIKLEIGNQIKEINFQDIDPSKLDFLLRFPKETRDELKRDKPKYEEEKQYFEKTFEESLKTVNFGNYGLRCHPDEIALVNNISVEF